MPTGLAIPVGVSVGGGAALVDGDDNDRKMIDIALGADDNENAFQQAIGLGEASIFDVDDPTMQSKVTIRLKQIFVRFERQKRLRLIPGTIRWSTDSKTGEPILEFKYLNLESDEVNEYSRTLTTNSNQR